MKTETKAHTPGPWIVQSSTPTDSGHDHHAIIADHGGDNRLPDHPVVASVIPYVSTDGARRAQEANARLIAAAPELLEACEEITALASDSDAGHIGFADALALIRALSEEARAAIAKARGED